MSGPWIKFYPTDWRADPKLRMCSVAARGLWMEMLCLMHEADPRGSLLVNGHAVSDKQLASLAGITCREATGLLTELEANGVFSRDDGVIYSRRIRRDIEREARDKANGRKGGNPNVKGGVNPQPNGQDKAQKLEAREDSEANASADLPPAEPIYVDAKHRLYGEGGPILVAMGLDRDRARQMMGVWRKAVRDDCEQVLQAIIAARDHRVSDPVPWITAALKTRSEGHARKTNGQSIQAVAREQYERSVLRELREAADASAPRLLSAGGSG
jgi:hypothetical protein